MPRMVRTKTWSMPNRPHAFSIIFPLFFLSNLMGQAPATPQGLSAVGYECHVDLRWLPNGEPNLTGYQLWRSTDGVDYTLLKNVGPDQTMAVDWTCDEGGSPTRYYRIKALAPGGQTSDLSPPASAATAPMTDEQLLDMVQRATFRYFWDFAHPVSGLARERNTSLNTVTMGGSGFGVMAIVVGADRGFITREQAVNRLIQQVAFLQFADRFHGVFPHWMDGTTGNVQAFSALDNGADLVETAFLMQGLLTARAYFDQDDPEEEALREVITALWEDVEWDWFRKNNGPVLYWHWSPQFEWQMNFPVRGFNEAQIVYILAIASPTHGVPASLYHSGWTGPGYGSLNSYYGYPVCTGPFAGGPLFFGHYSYLGFDPRDKKDAFCNYFERNRNHALMHRAYSISNPENHQGYSADAWGLTASDDPFGYQAHDPFPPNDNGTLTPTAALSSMPYTPDESLDALRHFYRLQGERLWGIYGFYDAYNLDQNWFATSYLAIDQGPIVGMIENYRTGLLWENFMKNPEIQPALDAIGFMPDASPVHGPEAGGMAVRVEPNPAPAGSIVRLTFDPAGPGRYAGGLLDARGQALRTFSLAANGPVATQEIDLGGVSAGLYFLRLQTPDGRTSLQKIILL
jgi:hypothetical protein